VLEVQDDSDDFRISLGAAGSVSGMSLRSLFNGVTYRDYLPVPYQGTAMPYELPSYSLPNL
jgi:hypothetical protein